MDNHSHSTSRSNRREEPDLPTVEARGIPAAEEGGIVSGIIHYIPTTGSIVTEKAIVAPSLAEMQKYVEGYVEVVHILFNNKQMQMVVNEEGSIKHLPFNWRATIAYGAASVVKRGEFPSVPILGNAVIFEDIYWE